MSRGNRTISYACVVCLGVQDFANVLWQSNGMSSKGAENLAQHVRARRDQLDLTQLEVHAAGGPSNTWQTLVEGGRIEALTRSTARKLDLGLQWERGSARRVWEGGEPLPLESPESASPLRRAILESRDLDDDTRAALLDLLDSRRPPPESPQHRTA